MRKQNYIDYKKVIRISDVVATALCRRACVKVAKTRRQSAVTTTKGYEFYGMTAEIFAASASRLFAFFAYDVTLAEAARYEVALKK